MASLDSALLKLQWAHDHYVELRDKEIGARGGKSQLVYPLTVQRERDGLEYRFNVGKIPPIDSEWWAGMVGDCLFNLRAALDHTVYALWLRRFRGKIPKRLERRPAFPILSADLLKRRGKRFTPETPCTEKWNEIGELSIRQRTAIQRYQPYITRKDSLRWTRAALADLEELNNIDKHRYLHVVVSAHFAVAVPTFPSEYGFRSSPTWGALKSDAEVDRWTFTSAPPEITEQMAMHNHAFGEICLDERGSYTPVLPLLEGLINHTGRVVARFSEWLSVETDGLGIERVVSMSEAAHGGRRTIAGEVLPH